MIQRVIITPLCRFNKGETNLELPEDLKLYLMTQPQHVAQARRRGLTPAHMLYRVGNGPHLFRSRSPVSAQGGVMVLDHRGFDGRGNAEPFCQEVIRECASRGFQGVFCDFEGAAIPVLQRSVERLAGAFQRRGWSLYVPENYAPSSSAVKVVVPTALSGGSLQQHLARAVQSYGAERVALGLEWVAEDFSLPAASGSGQALSLDELERLLAQHGGSAYFSDELCAHYFTYMHTGQSAHFVLYDTPASMAKKLITAAALGIREGFLPDPGRDDYLDRLFPAGI